MSTQADSSYARIAHLFEDLHHGYPNGTPPRSRRSHSRHRQSPRTPATGRRGPGEYTPRLSQSSYSPLFNLPTRSYHASAPHSQRRRSSDARVASSSLGKRPHSPHVDDIRTEDPTSSQPPVAKKRRGAKLRVAIQALNTAGPLDETPPADPIESGLLSYEEYYAMVHVIANAKKNAVESVSMLLFPVSKS